MQSTMTRNAALNAFVGRAWLLGGKQSPSDVKDMQKKLLSISTRMLNGRAAGSNLLRQNIAFRQLVQKRWSSNPSASSSPSFKPSSVSKDIASKVGKVVSRKKKEQKPNLTLATSFFTSGLPFILFCVLGAWTVSKSVGAKNSERDAIKGKVSKSIRQAEMEEEHDEMLDRLNTILKEDFDNTKRIKRPHEILEERRAERERRNKWYRRVWRWITRQEDQP